MTRSQGNSVLKSVPPSNVNPAASLKAAKNMKARLSTEKANSQTDYASATVEGTLLVGLSEGLLVGEPNRIVWPVTCKSMAIVSTENRTNTFYQ